MVERALQIGQRRLDDLAMDQGGGWAEAAIDVERGDHSLEGVCEQSRLATTTTALFSAAAESQVGSKIHAGCNGGEVLSTHQGGAQAGEISFTRGGEVGEERLGDDQAEHGVSQKLELLIVGRTETLGQVERGMLVRQRAMGQSLFEESGLLKGMARVKALGPLARDVTGSGLGDGKNSNRGLRELFSARGSGRDLQG